MILPQWNTTLLNYQFSKYFYYGLLYAVFSPVSKQLNGGFNRTLENAREISDFNGLVLFVNNLCR